MVEILHIHDMVNLQDLPYRTIEVDMQDFPNMTIDAIDLWEIEQIPHAGMKLIEGQILEEFMLEEEIEFQDIDKCKIVESPERPTTISYGQEECIEEEVCDSPLPRLYSAKNKVHETKLETPKINAIEINEKPREMRLEVAIPTRNILGDSVPKLHAKQTKILGSKLGRRVNTTRSVKREDLSMCRPPPKPPDGQNNLDIKARKGELPRFYYAREDTANYRPPKPPYILDGNGKVIGIIKNVAPKPGPPPKPPPKGL